MNRVRNRWIVPLGAGLASFAGGACTGGQGYDDGSDPITLGGQRVPDGSITRPITPEQFERATTTASDDGPDPNGGAWRVIEVPAASNEPSLVETPLGWLALSSRSVGDSRAPSGFENALYRSTDGVRWELLPLTFDEQMNLTAIAFGNGRYVMLGRRSGMGLVFWSTDAETWTALEQPVSDQTFNWSHLAFEGDHFFAMGRRVLGSSTDGETWSTVTLDNVQPKAVAFGADRYVLAGNGPMEVSEDGVSWTPHDVPCELPGACISDPDGVVSQSFQDHVVFAEGRFYSDQISSADGLEWRAEADRIPALYVDEHFVGDLQASPWGLPVWRSGGDVEWLRAVRPSREAVTAVGRSLTSLGVLNRDEPFPETVSVEFDDGLDCTTARCIHVGGRLLLIPPAGTQPVEDQVPRRDDGSPLLSDDCPVTSQISCDDYATRTGCTCDPEAPRSPSDCGDVSHYQCEGAFEHVPGEWELDEIREGGCDCDGSDPNQPATFGTACTAGDDACEAPLECLGIDTPASVGPPLPQPFVCTAACVSDEDCPTWEATGFCAGPVSLACSNGTCQPRSCE